VAHELAALAVDVLVGALMVVGVVGALVPFLPGTPLILAGALVYAVATGFELIGAGRLVILGALAGVSAVVPHVATAMGARRSGGSRHAMIGALIGTVAGLFFAPAGLLLGPLVGAVAGELVRSGDVRESLRSGTGAFLGMLTGALLHFVLALTMVGLFVWWVWRG
jgi:uncharacterized protein YqgC (DUF456 family)